MGKGTVARHSQLGSWLRRHLSQWTPVPPVATWTCRTFRPALITLRTRNMSTSPSTLLSNPSAAPLPVALPAPVAEVHLQREECCRSIWLPNSHSHSGHGMCHPWSKVVPAFSSRTWLIQAWPPCKNITGFCSQALKCDGCWCSVSCPFLSAVFISLPTWKAFVYICFKS